MTIPDDWVCYPTRCFNPWPPGMGLDILLVGGSIGLVLGLIIVLILVVFNRA